MSARLRLTLSYAVFLVAAGTVGVYVVLRYVPDYALTAADPGPRDPSFAPSRSDILDALVGRSGVILVCLAVIGLVGGWLLAGWILRPLRDINEATRIAATGRLDHRTGLSARSDEFGELAGNFDHMLDRLRDAFAAQERFVGNASHELRTPLAVTATMLDVARADLAGQDFEVLLERLQITNARAIQLTEALLRLSDANAVSAAFEPVDLATIAREALADHAGEAEPRDTAFDSQLRPAPTRGDATLLAQLTVNLIQNAIRHGDGHARVSTGALDGSATLRVENGGPAYTAEAAAQLAEPFLRGDGRRAGGGYGLGLPLVERIAAAHDGKLTIAPRDGGGLVVTATLPSSQQRAIDHL